MYKALMFSVLRLANIGRLPQFKNSKGEVAHSKEDGSDWSPAQWFQAVVGELGEWAEVRLQYERGEICQTEYRTKQHRELADVVTYMDILARRSLDIVPALKNGASMSPAQALMQLLAYIGTYANWRKKYERGDIDESAMCDHEMNFTADVANMLRYWETHVYLNRQHPSDAVVHPHNCGIDLGLAVTQKFNEVSSRVGASVYIKENRVVDVRKPTYLVTRRVSEEDLTPEEKAEFDNPEGPF